MGVPEWETKVEVWLNPGDPGKDEVVFDDDETAAVPVALEDALERHASLTVGEYERLGIELAAGVVRYREAVYSRSEEVVPYVPFPFVIYASYVAGGLLNLSCAFWCSAVRTRESR